MRRREHEVNRIEENSYTITHVNCTNCRQQHRVTGDSLESARLFRDKGWRATEKNIYCPACANKKLKSK